MNVRRVFTRLAVALMLLAGSMLSPGFADDDDRFVVSLGTSLSVGIQPGKDGVNRLTDEGYADQLFDILRHRVDDLELVKLGCPGETSTSMIVGGKLSNCTYPAGSQLAQSEVFLEAHQGAVSLVTLDMGANDVVRCPLTDLGCIFTAFATVQFNLATTILPALREAAGPDVPIVAMNYYNPNLAFWVVLGPPDGPMLAVASNQLADIFNTTFLETTYQSFGIPVADVWSAFQSDDFTPGPDLVPVNVAVICDLTWMCDLQRGPNIHARREGYAVIAEAFAGVVGDLDGDDDSDDSDSDDSDSDDSDSDD